MTSKRSLTRTSRPVHSDTFIHPWPEAGLVLFNSPYDPPAGLRIENGRIVELDGKPESEFDALDRFIARHSIDCEAAPEAMALQPRELARMLTDTHVPRTELVRLCGGLTPARLMQVVAELNVLEMMIALAKMRARRTPANQAHVSNRK